MSVELIPGITQSTLNNGLRVVTEPIAGVRSVSVGLWVNIGSRDESSTTRGATHFLEHLLFKGTERRNALQLAQVLDEVGGDMNAFTTKEYTAYHARCMDRDLGRAVDVLSDMLTSSTFPQRDYDSEKEVVLEEINIHLDTPDDLVHSLFSDTVFGSHALGLEILGSKDSITNMHRDTVMEWWKDQYHAQNVALVCAGNISHDEVVSLAEDALGSLASGRDRLVKREAPFVPLANRKAFVHKPIEQAHVMIGRLGLPRGHRLRWALAILNQILGGGMSSRLFQKIREELGLAYTVYSFHQTFADCGMQGVYMGVSPKKLEQAVDAVQNELTSLIKDSISGDELRMTKGYLTGATLLALEDTYARMSRIGRSMATGQELLSFDDIIEAIESVTLDDVSEAIEEVISGENAIAVVGNVDSDLIPDGINL